MEINKNCEDNLISYLTKNIEKKIYILTGKNSYYFSGAYSFFKKNLKNRRIKFYFKKEKIPQISELKKIIIDLKIFNPDIILAVGGGSVIDYAKLANSFKNVYNLKSNIINSKNKFYKLAQLVAIPTTAGSGAEITSGAVVYINKVKYSVDSKQLIPDYFFLIPRFVLKNNKHLKSSAGFDAISQSIESLISRNSNKISVEYAISSLKLSLKHFLPYLKKSDYKNCNLMLIASNLSGKAISISKTTAPHAVSYPLTSHFGISHGDAVSITLEDFLLFNYLNLNRSDVRFNLKDRYNILFQLTKSKNIFDLISFIKTLKDNAKTEMSFKKLNIRKEILIPKIMSGINLKRLSNNPIALNASDIKFILENKF